MVCIFCFNDLLDIFAICEGKIYLLAFFSLEIMDRVVLRRIINFCMNVFKQACGDKILKLDAPITIHKTRIKKVLVL